MKSILLTIIILASVILPPTVYAENNPAKKLIRGGVNIITAPLEIPKQARACWIKGSEKTDHILVWIFSGTVKGIVEGIKRAGSGTWDVLTFPFGVPDNFEPLLKPDYVFKNWPRRN